MLRDVRSMGTTDDGIRRLILRAARLSRGLAAGYPAGTDECVRPYMSSLGLGV